MVELFLLFLPMAAETPSTNPLIELATVSSLPTNMRGLGPAFHEFSASIRECDSPLFAEIFNKLVDRDFSPT